MLNNDDINHIQSSTKQQPRRHLKFHTYLFYHFELDFGIAIQPSMSASSNLGFESLVGVFG